MEASTTAGKDRLGPEAEVVPAVTLTADAAEKIRALLEEDGRTDLKLRVYVTGGGCAGFQYNFAFDEKREEDDFAVEWGGVTVVIDPRSLPFLAGAQIRYEEDLSGARFVVVNPNAASTCSCGSSFSTCSQSEG
ncbi:putative chaperone involved in Fe-S cluster assembly and activation; hesB-like [Methylacidimicrobium sp. AP8]|uniref:iron-sulfur cluster insertion protein ErpA n=1 Tax=Methylacidimicrobium sp. AP8 TaxID=2730359 RepID=UPI0018C13214|nr:iron-sulfur cluster insertion protein ErpA [Methylacidimicrobium sp. AP8]CAB4243381.1 putative chaperone involved in Fe-S cluster assembly and activation; hesB-like [Methylacidimicrobium sp. AP8]